ncbi:oligopeptide ABC transporter permease [Metabacillus sp. HB246100]|uniref:oligopeptide ABC transporter permease n=1 Tax=Bacillus weihaiensis TaxID=1547283 RepID=UPI002353981C|nr:oligopeptide ABC transporter permease [Bacillus weihaiensis]
MSQHDEKISKDLFEPASLDSSKSEEINKPSLNYWQDAWLRVRKNKAAIVSIVVLFFLTILSLVGPYLNDYDYSQQNAKHSNLPPKVEAFENISWLPFDGTLTKKNGEVYDAYELKGADDAYYWFGTDSLGRDIFTRVWKGTQVSLYIALLAAVIDMIIGVAYGAISGYFGGRVDTIMQRIIEILVGIPNLVVVILMIIILEPGILSITIALTITGWVGMARVVRGQVLKYKNQEFVLASRTLGAGHAKIITKHLMPNLVGVIIINTMFTIPSAIFFEAFLSFIGLGLKPPLASLGTLIDDGFKSLVLYPYQMIFPAIVISTIMICFNMIADGLRDALDPKMRD